MILSAKNISVAYEKKTVLRDVSIDIYTGDVLAIIGPNGSGKSTLMKTLSRTLRPQQGHILLEGKNLHAMNGKSIARRLAILPQVRTAPGDMTVEALISHGRYPHLGFGHRLNREDYEIIDWAMKKTGILALRSRLVETLSGGERQRAWIAMALVQKPSILLLDEPTTFLDISYQLETLELIKELNEKLGLTIIMVLHDLNQAVRYSNKILALKDGETHFMGNSKEFLTDENLREIFKVKGDIFVDQANQCNYFIPQKVIDSSAVANEEVSYEKSKTSTHPSLDT